MQPMSANGLASATALSPKRTMEGLGQLHLPSGVCGCFALGLEAVGTHASCSHSSALLQVLPLVQKRCYA